ncbi:MAG TPA: thioredoxin [Caldithrix abyssi]|uniref:Thioredoxin n=1 Tax=Caldithrix abyssi TaxID=187145 RepID=A0A7V5PQG3_CALAY|nr:thioredoxin [Caldithrix abyssi]
MQPIHVTDYTFAKEVLESPIPVLVDFWAPWCAPCRLVAPILEELSQEYQGRLKIVKLNTDENPGTAMKYNVMSIPTLMLFRNGEMVDEMIGAVPKHVIKNNLDYYLHESSVLN